MRGNNKKEGIGSEGFSRYQSKVSSQREEEALSVRRAGEELKSTRGTRILILCLTSHTQRGATLVSGSGDCYMGMRDGSNTHSREKTFQERNRKE